VFLFVCCSSNDQEKKSDEPKQEPVVAKSKKVPIRLYHVDSIFYKYMPDTNRYLKDPDELRDYFFATSETFRKFTDSILDKTSNKDSAALARRQAGILFDDLMEVNNLRVYKKWRKDNRNMMMLGAFSPFSRIVNLQERKDFFKTFPPEIQNNDVGKRTLKMFDEYSFDKNIDSNVHEFDYLEITDSSNKKFDLKNIYHSVYEYYILIFGASWCYPCRLGELQLKSWVKYIDTIKIKIVALSLDKNANKWKKYLEEDEYPWNSYRLQGEWNNKMVRKMNIGSIPRIFLLDSTGKVIAENVDIRKILKAIPILETIE